MIRDNQRVLNRIHVLLDALVIGGSYFLAWFIKFRLLSENEVGVGFLPAETYFRALYFIVPVYLGLYNWCGLYMSKRYSSSGREIFNLIKANSLGIGLFIALLYVLHVRDFSRSVIFLFYIISLAGEIFFRQIIRIILRTLRNNGKNLKHVILIGYSRAAERYITRLQENPQWGYDVCGILDDHIPAGTLYKGVEELIIFM